MAPANSIQLEAVTAEEVQVVSPLVISAIGPEKVLFQTSLAVNDATSVEIAEIAEIVEIVAIVVVVSDVCETLLLNLVHLVTTGSDVVLWLLWLRKRKVQTRVMTAVLVGHRKVLENAVSLIVANVRPQPGVKAGKRAPDPPAKRSQSAPPLPPRRIMLGEIV